MATEVLELLSSTEVGAKELQGDLDAFLSQVGNLSKAGSFSASDAKTYGPSLIKVVNTCVKQASQKELEAEMARVRLGAAGRGIELLHMMSKHLSCKPLDLDKICQNMTQNCIGRQMVEEARSSTEGMLVRLERYISAGVGAGKAAPQQRKYGAGNNKENRPKASSSAAAAAAGDWRDALNVVLAASADPGRKVDVDECSLVMGCLANLASLAISDAPLDRICGLGYLRWARMLSTMDADLASRLCGNMYKGACKAASAADALAKAAKPGSKEHAAQSASAVTIRCYSMIYLAMSGKMKLCDVVLQAIKAAKCYEKSPGASATLVKYHADLAEHLELQFVRERRSEAPDALALAKATSDWAVYVASFAARTSAQGASQVVAAICRTIEGLMASATLAVSSKRGHLYLSAYPASLCALLTAAAEHRLIQHDDAEAWKVQEERLQDGADHAQSFACDPEGDAASADLNSRIVRAAEALRVACTSAGAASRGAPIGARIAAEDALRRTLTIAADVCKAQGDAKAADTAADSLKRSVDLLIACATIGSDKGRQASAASLNALVGVNPTMVSHTILSSACLHNMAVAAYNEKRFADAVGPLTTACSLVPSVQGLSTSDCSLMARRFRLLAFSLHGLGDSTSSLPWAAKAAVLHASSGDAAALSSIVGEIVMLKAASPPGSVTTRTISELAGEEARGEEACLALLLAELRSGLTSRRPCIASLLSVCDSILSSKRYAPSTAPVRRARVLVDRAKLLRAAAAVGEGADGCVDDAAGNEVEGVAKSKGKSKGKESARGKKQAKRQAACGGEALAVCEEACGLLLDAGAIEKSEDSGMMPLLAGELGCALTWKAVLMLESGWDAHGGACKSACSALRLFGAHATIHRGQEAGGEVEGMVERGGERVYEHLVLLSDLLGLHGQEALSLHALSLAEACQGGGEGGGGLWRGRLALQWAVGGYPGRVKRMLSIEEGGAEDAEGSDGGAGAGAGRSGGAWQAALERLATAAAASAEGDGAKAREVLEGWQGVDEARADGGRAAVEEVMAWEGAVVAEVLLQNGDGVGALASAISGVHSVMASARGAATQGGIAGSGEGDDSGAGAIGRGVVSGAAVATSQWRLLCSAARGLERVGQLASLMGRGREAEYYWSQGVDLAKGCMSAAWRVRFTLGLASVKIDQALWAEARDLLSEAGDVIEASCALASPSLSFLEAEKALWKMLEADVSRGEGGAESEWMQLLGEAKEHVSRAEEQATGGAGGVGAWASMSGLLQDSDVALVVDSARASMGGKCVPLPPKAKSKGKGIKEAGEAVSIGEAFEIEEVSVKVMSLKARIIGKIGQAKGGGDVALLRKAADACPKGDAMLAADILSHLGALSTASTLMDCEFSGPSEGSARAPPNQAKSGADAAASVGAEKLESLKVAELKERCEAMNLPTTGKKADLVARIKTALSDPRSTSSSSSSSSSSSPPASASASASVSGGTTSGSSGGDGHAQLMRVWDAAHPNGPPSVIKRCGTALAHAAIERGDVELGAYYALASVGITARQVMSSWVEAKGGGQQQQGQQGHKDKDRKQVGSKGKAGATVDEVTRRMEGLGLGGRSEMLCALDMRTDADAGGGGKKKRSSEECRKDWIKGLCGLLPADWRVTAAIGGPEVGSIRLVSMTKEGGVEVGAPSPGWDRVIEEFDEVMRLSRQSLIRGGDVQTETEKKLWWEERNSLDARLGAMLESAGALLSNSSPLLGNGVCDEGHTILILDDSVQHLPWENMPQLRGISASRMPSAACLYASLLGRHGHSPSYDPCSGFYVLNPAGDLSGTQATFSPAFKAQPWQGVCGEPPSEDGLAQALASSSLFVFCGHGAGERYISATKLRSTDVGAVAVLMGCSSGRLKKEGIYEPRGMALSYITSGCPMVVGNLWDVSDRDIDRFADALLRMGAYVNDPPPSASVPAGRQGSKKELPPVQSSPHLNLVQCVAAARDRVRMRWIIGAAPVCYGLPAHIQGVASS